jgi:hypothetical protein
MPLVWGGTTNHSRSAVARRWALDESGQRRREEVAGLVEHQVIGVCASAATSSRIRWASRPGHCGSGPGVAHNPVSGGRGPFVSGCTPDSAPPVARHLHLLGVSAIGRALLESQPAPTG